MTHHNITHSEAGRPIAHVRIRTMPRRRRANEVVLAHAGALVVGAVASALDVLIGQPVFLVLVGAPFLGWCFWPSRR